jgi:prepilin-type N-terminal cleavage/methylation domain-containing protein
MMQIKKIMRYRLRNDRGFTLIEIIAVLVILAIISAVVISRGTMTDAASLQAEVDTLKGHLRYAQYLALNDISQTTGYATPTKWGINISGTTSYNLVKYVSGVSAAHTFSLPGESSATHDFKFSSGTTVAVTGNNPILFDEWGSPGTTSSSITIGGQAITITANTGFIQ